MPDIPTSLILAVIGFGCGLIIGGVAQANRFCTFGAIEDYVLAGRTERLRAWGLAIATAILLVSVLYRFGNARIDQAFYLSPDLPLGGIIIGGLTFGFGMSLLGTCGFGILVRLGGGDLKAFVAFLVLGFSAYAAAHGFTAPARAAFEYASGMDLTAIGGQGIPHILAALLNIEVKVLWLPVGVIFTITLGMWCFKSPKFRASRRDIVSGLTLGVVVAVAFAATGIIGADPFDPRPVASMTFVLPPGNTIVYLMTFTGASLNFGIGTVLGTVLGAFTMAVCKGEHRWEAFDGRREMRRHIAGAFFMGLGGVMAFGCTIGQGMTGMSTLSTGAPLALLSIFIGATFGIHYLLSENLPDAVRSFFIQLTPN